MKIKNIYIENYKNLKNFEINFNNSISIFIWKNWSWKSNFLEALTIIFSNMYDYINSSKKNNHPKKDFKYNLKISINSEEKDIIFDWKRYNLTISELKNIFPTRIIWYYSWDNLRLKEIFDKKDQELILKIRDREITEWKTFFYFQPYYFELALVYLYMMKNYSEDIQKELFSDWKINLWEFKKLEITFEKPSWWKNTQSYWWSKWILLDILKLLEENSNEGKFLNKKSEFILSFDDLDFFMYYDWVWKNFNVFEAFDSLFINGLIKKLEIKFKRWEKELSSTLFSEWERQFIIINWLKFYFSWNNTDSLFLMDEPDTYLHPNWQKLFIPTLYKENKDNNSSFIITTHSPLMVGSEEKIDIYWLEDINWVSKISCWTNENIKPKTENFEIIDVYWNRAEFIYEKVFWLESTRAIDFEKEVNKLHKLLQKKAEWEELNKEELEQIWKLKELIKNKLQDDIDDLYLSYLSIDDLSKIIKENYEKNK